LSLGIGTTGSSAFALPEYTVKEKKDCRYCHVGENGGGPTNTRGRYYKTHMSFEGFIERKSAVKPKAPKKPAKNKKAIQKKS
jgi:hypothetical protein